jgi:hypothetical protein
MTNRKAGRASACVRKMPESQKSSKKQHKIYNNNSNGRNWQTLIPEACTGVFKAVSAITACNTLLLPI